MFLEVKQTSCAEVPERLMSMLQAVLEYSIRSFVQDPEFEELFHVVEKKLHYLLKSSKVHTAIEKLFQLPYLERTKLCDIFEHDSCFPQYMDDAAYQLKEDANQEEPVLKELCNAVYEAASAGAGKTSEDRLNLDLKLYKSRFSKENGALGRVCPVCVRELLFSMGEGELDHYFPRKKYPVLALHPYNLLPVCADCNSARIKHMKSPLDAQDRGPGELQNIFLPYLRPARPEVVFEVSEDAHRNIVMRPREGSSPYTQRRIENMERLYNLGPRWSLVLQNVYDDIKEELSERRDERDTPEVRIRKLREILKANEESTRGRTEFVKGVYCGWLNGKTDEELANLFA